ncbi:MAG: hypothetical protein WBP59_15090, partial [Ilumatobacteraceae bacterium]
MNPRLTRVLTLAATLATLAAVSACGSDTATSSGTEATSTPVQTTPATPPASPETTVTAPDETTAASTASTTPDDAPPALDPDAPDLGNVVALAEEFLLADLLSLGVEPVASSATVETVGFQGLDEFDTSDIEVLPMTTLSLEHLATLEPDTIITLQYWADQIGQDILDGLGEVIIVPDGLYGPER